MCVRASFILMGNMIVTILGSCSIRDNTHWSGKEVNCVNTGLVSIPGDLPNDVTFLNLRDNHLTQVTADDFHYTSLRALDLAFNDITKIDTGTFVKLIRLESLDLRYNNLSYATWSLPPKVLLGLDRLTHLYIEQSFHHRHVDLHCAYPTQIFQDVPNLELLNIEALYHDMPVIPDEIASLSTLHTLRIGSQSIVFIGENTFSGLWNTSIQSISFNFLRTARN